MHLHYDRRDGTEEEVLKNGMLRAFGMRTVERYKICVLCFAFQRFIATFDSEESTKDMRKILLMPAAFLYKQAVRLRHRLFDWGVLRSEKFDVPVICIGNITVGGTGKTPMAEMVIAYMRQTHNVALLYDASSCGSIPVIRNLEEYYDNDLLLEDRKSVV